MLFTLSDVIHASTASNSSLSLDQAHELVSVGFEFPVVVNPSVLSALNAFINTEAKKKHFKTCLERKKNFSKIVHSTLRKYQLPEDLAAIPIVESCYDKDASASKRGPKGLWMLSQVTARNLGLIVNSQTDERTDMVKSTDAALKYYRLNLGLFTDQSLALLAYNSGEGAVKRAIKKYDTHNPWILREKKIGGDPDYLPKVLAAMILLKHPKLLD